MTKPWAILTRQASDNLLRECGYEVKAMTSPELLWNADDWHLFICQHCDNRATSPNGMNKVALKVADTMAALRASGHGAGREAIEREAQLLWELMGIERDAGHTQGTWQIIRDISLRLKSIAATPVALERTAGRYTALTKIAAECHRSKWQFDLSEDYKPSAAAARSLIKKSFDELHRIGDAVLKLRDAAPSPDDQPEKQA